ncbi:class II histone deacetylase [Oceanobacillus oncorhynchi subsp. incaldanensis]|uniref:Class II histone deacetylase n=1 Tax=Oceanobacillus aidingensis TaxID=645964 RepID=A0ABV9K2P3_9BACI|nr:class II histone deacetylase [Oceanobacillus oncorhynchi]MDM8099806.1 class II histone deacetylase [Oceanobacillus oncorhynchi]GIO20445.1 class II histone deacetylase [Oceanobacillus oncorhynchi subsp. incaldanensis]
MERKTGFIVHESYFWHDTGNGALSLPPGGWIEADEHGESPKSKRRIKNLLERSEFIEELQTIKPKEATREEVEKIHDPSYVEKVKQLSNADGGDAGLAALVGRDSYEIALLSAGGTMTGVDAVMNGDVQNVYTLTRPPGHHAEKDQGMGFCLFNNVAIAANYAREKYGLKRIMVLDWDVHHGNGTENIFYEDSEILFISLHQELNFPPNRGFAEHTGSGDGEGYNVNIPLPAGTGNAGYKYALEKLVTPIAKEFKPELIIVSAGQDANVFDPLARMMVTAEGYGEIASLVKEMAGNLCSGRLVVSHEGGYSAAYVPFCTLRIIESLTGLKSKVTADPYQEVIETLPTNILKNNQKEAVDEIVERQSRYWNNLKVNIYD